MRKYKFSLHLHFAIRVGCLFIIIYNIYCSLLFKKKKKKMNTPVWSYAGTTSTQVTACNGAAYSLSSPNFLQFCILLTVWFQVYHLSLLLFFLSVFSQSSFSLLFLSSLSIFSKLLLFIIFHRLLHHLLSKYLQVLIPPLLLLVMMDHFMPTDMDFGVLYKIHYYYLLP